MISLSPHKAAIMVATAAYVVENPVAMHYFSMVPYKLGPQAMKFSARPAPGQALRTAQEKSDNYRREVMVEQLASGPVVYEFFVQVQRDSQRFPVEDPTVVWPEDWVSPTQPALPAAKPAKAAKKAPAPAVEPVLEPKALEILKAASERLASSRQRRASHPHPAEQEV